LSIINFLIEKAAPKGAAFIIKTKISARKH